MGRHSQIGDTTKAARVAKFVGARTEIAGDKTLSIASGPIRGERPEDVAALVQMILDSRALNNVKKGHRSREVLELLFERYQNKLGKIGQAEFAARLFPRSDPSTDSAPRRAINRLRIILRRFFETEGHNLRLRVRLPARNYELEFYKSDDQIEDVRKWFWLAGDRQMELYPRGGSVDHVSLETAAVSAELAYLLQPLGKRLSFGRSYDLNQRVFDFDLPQLHVVALSGPVPDRFSRTIIERFPNLDFDVSRENKVGQLGWMRIVNRNVQKNEKPRYVDSQNLRHIVVTRFPLADCNIVLTAFQNADTTYRSPTRSAGTREFGDPIPPEHRVVELTLAVVQFLLGEHNLARLLRLPGFSSLKSSATCFQLLLEGRWDPQVGEPKAVVKVRLLAHRVYPDYMPTAINLDA